MNPIPFALNSTWSRANSFCSEDYFNILILFKLFEYNKKLNNFLNKFEYTRIM